MVISLEITGITNVRVKFSQMAKRVQDVEPVAPVVGNVLRNAARETFLMMGERGEGPAWDPGTQAWIDRKIREGYDPRPEMMTHALFNSLTQHGSIKFGKSFVSLGSNVKYAKFQKNQLVKLTVDERNEIRQIWYDFIVHA
jgi:phage gpG-like protein